MHRLLTRLFDYIREHNVTDLTTYIGGMPNIFAKKELIPPPYALELKTPILSLGQMAYIRSLVPGNTYTKAKVYVHELSITFERIYGIVGLRSALDNLCEEAVRAVKDEGCSILLLTDRKADFEQLPIPVLIAQRAVVTALTEAGLRLKTSLVIDTAQVRTTHQLATLIGFGCTAVCPYLALKIARQDSSKKMAAISSEIREKNMLKAFESGLLKVMSKMGISVIRSYKSSRLFTILGLDNELCEEYFQGVPSLVGGWGLEEITEDILRKAEIGEESLETGKLINTYQFKEQARNASGEKHSMTNSRSKIIHELVRNQKMDLTDMALYDEYLKAGEHEAEPVSIRHLLDIKTTDNPIQVSETEEIEEITKRFGSGAMSFGAISAESQRDIILAMRELGGRSNSGEGGENPYYFTEGISASVKQIASGRFGVTATYLVTAKEIQIKIAQGAKPGEGGQLMAPKVNEDIARQVF